MFIENVFDGRKHFKKRTNKVHQRRQITVILTSVIWRKNLQSLSINLGRIFVPIEISQELV